MLYGRVASRSVMGVPNLHSSRTASLRIFVATRIDQRVQARSQGSAA